MHLDPDLPVQSARNAETERSRSRSPFDDADQIAVINGLNDITGEVAPFEGIGWRAIGGDKFGQHRLEVILQSRRISRIRRIDDQG